MVTKKTMSDLRLVMHLAALVVVLGVPLGLWIGGAQPIAVGLVPAPWDKVVHATVFALLAAAIGYVSGLSGWRVVVVAFAGALLVGVGDEWHQAYLPGRSAGWDDLAADALGAALGAAALPYRARLKNWLLQHRE